MQPPIIILVAPQMGENIGAAARAMGNFGLSELRIVSPRDGWPNPAAIAMAAHGVDIIKNAAIFDTLDDAIADCQQVYATSARLRDMNKPVLTAREFGDVCQLHAKNPPKTAILFGRENSGLNNEEVSRAHSLLTIPVTEACPSINLAQSVNIIAYEWRQATQQEITTQSIPDAPLAATSQEVEGFLGQLESALDAQSFWKVPAKKPRMFRNIRNLFLRSSLSEQEVQTLRGVVSSLTRKS